MRLYTEGKQTKCMLLHILIPCCILAAATRRSGSMATLCPELAAAVAIMETDQKKFQAYREKSFFILLITDY